MAENDIARESQRPLRGPGVAKTDRCCENRPIRPRDARPVWLPLGHATAGISTASIVVEAGRPHAPWCRSSRRHTGYDYGTRVRKEEPMIAVYADHRGIQQLIESQISDIVHLTAKDRSEFGRMMGEAQTGIVGTLECSSGLVRYLRSTFRLCMARGPACIVVTRVSFDNLRSLPAHRVRQAPRRVGGRGGGATASGAELGRAFGSGSVSVLGSDIVVGLLAEPGSASCESTAIRPASGRRRRGPCSNKPGRCRRGGGLGVGPNTPLLGGREIARLRLCLSSPRPELRPRPSHSIRRNPGSHLHS